MGEALRVVLDTNVWVSIALDKSLAEGFLPLIQTKQIEVYLSRALLEELARVLAYPKIRSTLERAGVQPVVALSRIVESATLVSRRHTIAEIKEDPADNRVLECALSALSAKASFIVTGDKHVLGLDDFRGIKILRARAFLDMMESRG